jgi:PPOX class probable F420-dependent enzyme
MTIPEEVRELLEARNFGHVATLLPDGSPHSVPVWIGVERGRVAFFTQAGSRKARNLARDGRVALSVTDGANPYRSAWLRGRVAQTLEGNEALRVIDGLAEKYTGAPFPMRSGVVFLVEAERAGVITLPFRHAAPAAASAATAAAAEPK